VWAVDFHPHNPDSFPAKMCMSHCGTRKDIQPKLLECSRSSTLQVVMPEQWATAESSCVSLCAVNSSAVVCLRRWQYIWRSTDSVHRTVAWRSLSPNHVGGLQPWQHWSACQLLFAAYLFVWFKGYNISSLLCSRAQITEYYCLYF